MRKHVLVDNSCQQFKVTVRYSPVGIIERDELCRDFWW
jgi:hypothetical protein